MLTIVFLLTTVPADRVFEVDPVELVAGRETPGLESISHQHGGFTYRFRSKQNLETFLKEPQRFEIQFGGGCGRMGPLSGVGRTSIYTVYKNRIYIFASEQCRTGFLKRPDKLIDRDDPRPKPTPESRRQAMRLLNVAARRVGSPEAWDKLKSLRWKTTKTVSSGGREYHNEEHETVVFPASFRRDSIWDDERWGYVSKGQKGWFDDNGEKRLMVGVQVRALNRRFFGHPIVVLANRNRKDFVAERLKPLKLDGDSLNRVRVWLGGTAAILSITETGDIVSTTIRDRGKTMDFVNVERRYSEFRELNGVRMPTVISTLNDNKPIGKPVRWECEMNRLDVPAMFDEE